ncbi:MAG: twin-arginine translocase subunit TatC [Chloroflexi bacterium]|nr:twin-arginine translocase subunit TatC [Chloroflexota bacterium]
MSLLEHLSELRYRLILSLLALGAGTVISLVFAREIFQLLLLPVGGGTVIALNPTETIVVYFKVSILSGLVLAMPVILYQFIRFLAPGLTPREKRYLYLLVPAASLSFALGVVFAASVILPFAVNYLQGFLSDVVTQTWAISPYIDFVVTFLLAMGLVFETPLVIFFLAKIGIVTPAFLSHYRRHAIVLIAVIAAVITPTPDPFNMMLVMLPLWGLYEVGILLARFAR